MDFVTTSSINFRDFEDCREYNGTSVFSYVIRRKSVTMFILGFSVGKSMSAAAVNSSGIVLLNWSKTVVEIPYAGWIRIFQLCT